MLILSTDNETWPFDLSCQTPPPICLSYCTIVQSPIGGWQKGQSDVLPFFRGKGIALDALEAWLEGDTFFVGANTAFDTLTSIVGAYQRSKAFGDKMFRLFVKAYDENRVTDVFVRQKLLDLSFGSYRKEGGYSLKDLSRRFLGKERAKGDESWQKRFSEVEFIEPRDYPFGAREYSLEDSLDTADIWICQNSSTHGGLRDTRLARNFPGKNPLVDEFRQTRAALALYATSAYGLRTDPDGVKAFEIATQEAYEEVKAELVEAGLIRREYSRDAALTEQYIRARGLEKFFGQSPAGGMSLKGKDLLATGDYNLRRLAEWKYLSDADKAALVVAGVARCDETRDTKEASRRIFLAYARPQELGLEGEPREVPRTKAWDPYKPAKTREVWAQREDGSVCVVTEVVKPARGNPAHTPDSMECVALDKDACVVSEDPIMEKYAEFVSLGKTLSTDLKALHMGTEWPIHARFENILETGRVSASKPNTMNPPRKPGARECYTAREGTAIIDCLVPGTRVLTAALLWVPIETLKPGDEVIGFDELPEQDGKRVKRPKGGSSRGFRDAGAGRSRRIRSSIVKSVVETEHECYEIVTDKATVTASANHMWLARPEKGTQLLKWQKTCTIKPGDQIPFLAAPWEFDASYEAAWMAGVYDGEGDLGQSHVGFGQNPGLVLDKVTKFLDDHNYQYSVSKHSKCEVRNVVVRGGRAEAMRFIGSIRPVRLYAKSRKLWQDTQTWGKTSEPATVLSVRPVGRRKTIAVETSTHTMIAEGLFSHNCDFPSLELSTLAQACYWSFGYSIIGETLKKGRDIHLETATEILHRSYEDLQAHKKTPEVSKARTLGKPGIFGVPGGLGKKKLAEFSYKGYGLRLSLKESDDLIKTIKRKYPEIADHFRWVEAQRSIDAKKFIDVDGREKLESKFNIVQPWAGRLRADATYCAAANTIFQGLGSDVAKYAMWLIWKACYGFSELGTQDPLYLAHGRIVHFIHDQFLVEVSKADMVMASRAGWRVAELMNRAGKEIMPDTNMQVEPVLANCWSKKAATFYVRSDGTATWSIKEAALHENGKPQLALWDLNEQCREFAKKLYLMGPGACTTDEKEALHYNGKSVKALGYAPATSVLGALQQDEWPGYVIDRVALVLGLAT